MIKRDILETEIWECSPEEARAAWKDHPADRHRIWTNAEVSAHILSDPETLQRIIDQKRAKPGSCL